MGWREELRQHVRTCRLCREASDRQAKRTRHSVEVGPDDLRDRGPIADGTTPQHYRDKRRGPMEKCEGLPLPGKKKLVRATLTEKGRRAVEFAEKRKRMLGEVQRMVGQLRRMLERENPPAVIAFKTRYQR